MGAAVKWEALVFPKRIYISKITSGSLCTPNVLTDSRESRHRRIQVIIQNTVIDDKTNMAEPIQLNL